MRLLFAEDDSALRDALARGLREHAYAVDSAVDGSEALVRAVTGDYDAIILDVLMPGCDGVAVCRELRRRGCTTPILLLTALGETRDKIAGLDAGADDYLTKPFAFDELLARVRALLRRRSDVIPATIVVGDLEVDMLRRVARRGIRDIPLTAKEYVLLEYMARNAGRVVTRIEITAHVWDENHEPGANLLDVYISRLRRKVDEPGEPPLLHTRRGMGVLLGEQDSASAARESP